MADFTTEELEEIRKTFLRETGGKYQDKFGTNLSGVSAFAEYLQDNRQRFTEQFAAEKLEREATEKQKEAEEKAAQENAERELELYLQSVYADEKGSSQDIRQETWDSSEYQTWRDNYESSHPSDDYYRELKDRIDRQGKAAVAETRATETPDESMPRVYTLADIERYLTLQEEYLKHTHDTKNADGKTAFELLHENAQKDLRDFVAGRLLIEAEAYEAMEEFIHTFADDYIGNTDMEKLAADSRAKLNELNKKELEVYLQSIYIEEKSTQDITQETWNSSEYQIWLDNYEHDHPADDYYRELKARTDRQSKAAATRVVEKTIVVDEVNRSDKSSVNAKLNDEEQDVARLRSANSDANEFMLDKVKLEVLLDMGVINQEIYDAGIQNPTAAIEKLNSRRPLNDKETVEYENRMADKMLNNEELFELLPPSILAKQYKKLREQLVQTAANDPNTDSSRLEALYNKVGGRIDELVDEYDSGIRTLAYDQYNFDDLTNIADIYDGYIEMLDARSPDVDADRAAKMNRVREKLDNDIKLYDQAWNLEELTEQDTQHIEDNQERLANQLSNINLSEQTQRWLDNISFTGEDNQPLPPEEQQKRRQTFVDFARNNTIISHLADKENVSQEELQKDFQDQLMLQVFSLANVEDALKGIAEQKDKFTNPRYLRDFETQMTNLNRPLTISDQGYKKGVQSAVNNTMACINRIGKHVGKENPLLRKLHAPIAKYDDRRADRFDNGGGYKRIGLGGWLKKFGLTAGATVASKAASFGIYKGAAMLGANLSLTASAGIAAVGLSTTGMLFNYRNYKKSQKAKNEKASFGDFLIRKPYRSQNIASTLGFVAGACLFSGHPELAMIAGAGALGVMGVSKWKEARKSGLNKKQAAWETIKQLSAVAAGAGVGSYLSSMFGMTPDTQKQYSEITKEASPGYTTHDYTADELNWAEMRNNDPRWSEFLNKYHVASDLQNPSDPNAVSADAMANLKAAITQAIGDNKEFCSDTGNGVFTSNLEMLTYKGIQLMYLAPNDGAITADGSPIGEILGYTDANGEHISYIDAFRQAISNGKVDNPQGFAEMLSKVENVIGGQNENGVNDMGKITLFGTHDPVSPVQSYNANADAGYNINEHQGTPLESKLHTETIPGHKIWALGYWEPVKEGVSKLKDRVGAFADKLFGKKKEIKLEPTPVPPTPPVDKEKANQDLSIVPVEVVKKEQLPEGKPIALLPEGTNKHTETNAEQNALPEHKTPLQIAQYSEISINEMLDKEYKIVHGHEPNKEEGINYKRLVLQEMQNDSMGTDNIGVYLQKRMEQFENTLANAVAPNGEARGIANTQEGRTCIGMAREAMHKSSEKSTQSLLSLTKCVPLHADNGDNGRPNASFVRQNGGNPRGN